MPSPHQRRTDYDNLRVAFFHQRSLGLDITNAARKVNIAPSTGFKYEAERKNGRRPAYRRAKRLSAGSPPERALADFRLFRRRYMGRVASPWQEDAANRIVAWLASPDKEYVVINAPPGVGKSTLFTHDIPCWLIARNRSIRILIGSATQRGADTYALRIKRTLERTYPIKADDEDRAHGLAFDAEAAMSSEYGPFRPPNADLWRNNQFTVEQKDGQTAEDKEATVTAWGRDGGFLGQRYDFTIWDDLVDEAVIRTVEAREKLARWWASTAERRLEPRGLLVLQGQRMAADDLYRTALDRFVADEIDEAGEPVRKYHHVVYPAHQDETCVDDHGPAAKAWPDGCLLDPARLPWREVAAAKADPALNFEAVFQQRDTDPERMLVNPLWLSGGSDNHGTYPGCYDPERELGVVPADLAGRWLSVVTVDPSPTRYWAVQWWLVEPVGQTQLLLDIFRGKMEAPGLLDFHPRTGAYTGLLEDWARRATAQRRPISHLIMERAGAQRFLTQYTTFRNWKARNSVLLIEHDTFAQNKHDHHYGVRSLGPHYLHGRVRLPYAHSARGPVLAMASELTRWPEGKTDDCVMAHWFLVWNLRKLHQPTSAPPKRAVPSWLRGKLVKV